MLTDIFLSSTENMDLADHIFAKRAPSVEPEWIGEILARLIWLTDDNGHEITNSLRRWLVEHDPLKVQVALLTGEVWLWETRGEMDGILRSVAEQFPALSELCSKRRSEWNRQFPGQ